MCTSHDEAELIRTRLPGHTGAVLYGRASRERWPARVHGTNNQTKSQYAVWSASRGCGRISVIALMACDGAGSKGGSRYLLLGGLRYLG